MPALPSPEIRIVAADWSLGEGFETGSEGLELGVEELGTVDADLALLLVGPDDRPLQGLGGFIDWRADGALTRLLVPPTFVGEWGERVLTPAPGDLPLRRLVLLGTGRRPEWSAGRASEFARELLSCVRKLRTSRVAVGWVDSPDERELWSEVFDALVALLRAPPVSAPTPEVVDAVIGSGEDEVQSGLSEADPAEEEPTQAVPAPDTEAVGVAAEAVAEGETARPVPAVDGAEPPVVEQWWIIAPEALCTRLRGRLLGTPRAADGA